MFKPQPSKLRTFSKDVLSLISVIEDLGNLFEEESTDLVLDSKDIADHAEVKLLKQVDVLPSKNQVLATLVKLLLIYYIILL